MPTRAFRIAYDGTGYHGFQRQPDVPTVEDAIFDALRDLEVLATDADKPDGYAAAGRTDAGVSALTQTVALEAPDWLTPRAFNAELPADIRAWAAADAPAAFHATHDAERREYTYHLYAPTVGSSNSDSSSSDQSSCDSSSNNQSSRDSRTRHSDSREIATGHAVTDDRFRAACEALSGSHDFHNLTPDEHNTERSPTLEATREGDFLVVTVTAGGFARELVRRLVSLAHEVGTGDADLERIDRALAPDPLPGHEGIAPAPPEPLVLTDVAYPDLAFETDADAAASAREIFSTRRIDRRTGARVAGQLADGIR